MSEVFDDAYRERTDALLLAVALQTDETWVQPNDVQDLWPALGYQDARAFEDRPRIALPDCPQFSVDLEGACPHCGHPVDEHWHRSGFWCADCIAEQMGASQ